MSNPLVSDELVDHLLYPVLHVERLCELEAFKAHSRDGTFTPYLQACRRLAREQLFPTYRQMDAEPPRLVDGRIVAHPKMHALWRALTELGVIAANRELPLTFSTLCGTYLMAANAAAVSYAGLTAGAAHLIEAFADEPVKATFLPAMLDGRWSGTMALTEPQAGSSLGDLVTRATPSGDAFLISGSKIFISGGDQDFTDNVVHLVLARVDGAPQGTRGITLFAVPRVRPDGTPNDVAVAGAIHKIGWRGLPSLVLNFGEAGACRGWRVGPLHGGLKCMFQMMNEARLMVGAQGAATASVAYHQSKEYALERRQGRPLGAAPGSAQVPLTEHPDVRRMLLKQKAIVEGALCLLGVTARYGDLAAHGPPAEREKNQLLLDLLTPIAKTFPAERGFESNVLALQVHGGYGYSSEYLPEAWLRDQKLNSLHEGTSGIQALDLLGRKVLGTQGRSVMLLQAELEPDLAGAAVPELAQAVREAMAVATGSVDPEALELALAHASDFLELMSHVVIGWMWLKLTNAAAGRTDAFARGLTQAARYWAGSELPKVKGLAAAMSDRSYVEVKADEL